MSVFNIHEAKTHLSRLVDKALDGGDVVIARANKPLVRLVPLPESLPARRLDTAAGLVRIAEDFDQPLADFDDYR